MELTFNHDERTTRNVNIKDFLPSTLLLWEYNFVVTVVRQLSLFCTSSSIIFPRVVLIVAHRTAQILTVALTRNYGQNGNKSFKKNSAGAHNFSLSPSHKPLSRSLYFTLAHCTQYSIDFLLNTRGLKSDEKLFSFLHFILFYMYTMVRYEKRVVLLMHNFTLPFPPH